MNPFPIRSRDPESCKACDELGIIRVKDLTDGIETLMRCDCQDGKNSLRDLPQWEPKLSSIFEKSKCPVDWFKPEKSGDVMESVLQKVEYWNAKLSIAEQYWKSVREQVKA